MTQTLPKGWEEKTLKDVLDKASSNIAANTLKDRDGVYPIYGASGLVKNIDFYQQESGYLAIIKDGAGVGRIYHYPGKTSVLGTLQYLFPKDNIDIRFAFYYLNSIDFLKYYQGAAIPHIYYKDYCNEKIILPPLPEQKRIVEKLDKIFADIDKAKENTKKNLENAVSVFEGYLNKQFKETTKNWIETTFAEEITIKSGDFLPAKSMNKNGKYEVYGGNGITGYHNIANYNGENVIIGRVGEKCGNVHYTDKDIWVTDNAFIVMHTEHDFDKKFLCSLLQMAKLRRYAAKSTHPVISGKSLRSVKLCFPISLSEQQEIVKELERLQIQTQKLEQIYTKKLVNLEELKQSVLQQAFSGKL